MQWAPTFILLILCIVLLIVVICLVSRKHCQTKHTCFKRAGVGDDPPYNNTLYLFWEFDKLHFSLSLANSPLQEMTHYLACSVDFGSTFPLQIVPHGSLQNTQCPSSQKCTSSFNNCQKKSEIKPAQGCSIDWNSSCSDYVIYSCGNLPSGAILQIGNQQSNEKYKYRQFQLTKEMPVRWVKDLNFGRANTGFSSGAPFLNVLIEKLGAGISRFELNLGPTPYIDFGVNIPNPSSIVCAMPFGTLEGHDGRAVTVISINGIKLDTPTQVTLDTGNTTFITYGQDLYSKFASLGIPNSITFEGVDGKVATWTNPKRKNWPQKPYNEIGPPYSHTVFALGFLSSYNMIVDEGAKIIYFVNTPI